MSETGLRARKKKQVREKILEVCGQLFRGRGFDETTIDDIVGAAEISRQTFFNYFPGKESVLAELGLAWLIEQGRRAQAGANTPAPDRVPAIMRQVLAEQFAAIERDRDFMQAVFTRSGIFFPHGPHVGSSADAPRLDQTREFFTGISALLQMARQAGVLRRDVAPEQMAEILVAVFMITTRLWLTQYWGDPGSLVERGLRAFDVVMAGLLADRQVP